MHEPFALKAVESCLWAVRSLLYPSYFLFNSLAALYFPTHEEQKNGEALIVLRKVVFSPSYAILLIILLPVMCVILPLRCLLVSLRRPYAYSEYHTEETSQQEKSIRERIRSKGYRFGIGSANICLMPEVLSKMNHLSNVDLRSVDIGQRIKVDQMMSHHSHPERVSSAANCNGSSRSVPNGKGGIEHNEVVGGVSLSFPYLDVLCIQEAWSSYHNKALIEELHKCFPYIVHDVGVHSLKVNSFLLNSGHLVASRHPIEAVSFKAYENFVDHGKIISMGLLMIKLKLGPTKNSGQNVAYVFNTHLQSYQGKHEIIPKQLDELLTYSNEFIRSSRQPGDNVAFCAICGDFNMDNLSPADETSTHHRIFELFEDFARWKPGLEKPWAVGTELRQDRMMDQAVSTPELLKAALEDPVLRQCYVVDGDLEEQTKEAIVCSSIKLDDQGNVRQVPEGGRRRIDYVLFDKQYPLEVKGYHFVTRLASLTDHIPVAMEFTCPNLM